MNIYTKFIQTLLRLLINVLGQPHMKRPPKQLEALIQSFAHSHPEELIEYNRILNPARSVMVLSLLITTYFTFHLLILPIHAFLNMDFLVSENNIKTSQLDGRLVTRFKCMSTDCSRFSKDPRESLADSFKKTGYFSTCHKNLIITPLYLPFDDLGGISVLNHCILATITTVMGIIYPILLYFKPTHIESIMMILAPNITQALAYERLRVLRQEYICSMKNFRLIAVDNKLDKYRIDSLKLLDANSPPIKHRKTLTKQPEEELSNMGNTQQDNLLPLVRCVRWSKMSAFHSVKFYVIVISGMSLTWIAYITYLTYVLFEHQKLMTSYQENTKLNNCSVWLTQTHSSSSKHIIDLTEENLTFNSLNFCFIGGYFGIFGLLFIFLYAIMWGGVRELSVWLLELEYFMELACEIARDTNFHLPVTPHNKLNHNPEVSKLGRLQEKLARSVDFGLSKTPLVNQHKLLSPDVEVSLELQAICIMLNQTTGSYAHIELIENIYLSFRLFLESVSSYGTFSGAVCVVGHLLIYAYAVIAVLHVKQMKDFIVEPLVVVILFMINMTLLIYIGANLHTKSKRMHPKLWSLIASLVEFKNVRVQHLRCLFLKIEEKMTEEGGIFMNGLGLKMQYSTIVELTFGTLTIIILALK